MTLVRRAALPAALIAVLGALGVLAPSPAAAAPGIRYGLKDDAWLLHGPGTLEQRLTKLDALGVQIVRFGLDWDLIAASMPADPADPSDPAYRWDGWDAVVQGLHRHGIETLLGILGTPSWANGGRPSNVAPSSGTSIAGFATAAARRFPWVRRWIVWNEPNQRRWLVPTSPAVYVTRLLNPAYAALHREIPGVLVGGGVTAPRGSTGGVSPIAWIAGMKKAHARLDAYAHNPYPLSPRETPTAGACSYCLTLTMATLPRLLDEVGRAFPNARVWLTEYGYQTRPPDVRLGIEPALQAQYESDAAMRAYLAPRVDLLIHFLYRDEPDLSRFQSGLTWISGKAKPAFAAFQLPLAERARHGSVVSLWGAVRLPGVHAYRLEVYRGGWLPLGTTLRTDARGFLTWSGSLPRHTRVRLTAAGVVAPAVLLD
jgi:hypothetical protein